MDWVWCCFDLGFFPLSRVPFSFRVDEWDGIGGRCGESIGKVIAVIPVAAHGPILIAGSR